MWMLSESQTVYGGKKTKAGCHCRAFFVSQRGFWEGKWSHLTINHEWTPFEAKTGKNKQNETMWLSPLKKKDTNK